MASELLVGMETFGAYKEISVTCDLSPLQVEGTLRSGERIYFRYRWGKISLKVSIGGRQIALYSLEVEREVDVPDEQCIRLMDEWTRHYLLRGASLLTPKEGSVQQAPPAPGLALSSSRYGRQPSVVPPRPAPSHAPDVGRVTLLRPFGN